MSRMPGVGEQLVMKPPTGQVARVVATQLLSYDSWLSWSPTVPEMFWGSPVMGDHVISVSLANVVERLVR
eukprot:scaffold2836_cov99-Cylindrotheca_fusiformis.AAC.10